MHTYETSELLGQLNERELKHAPSALHVAGDVELLRRGYRVAVAGSREATVRGIRRTRILVKELVDRDFVVVSGLARGVDTASHHAAIEFGGNTVAVLGTPLAVAYPEENRDLQNTLMKEHAVVSQFASGEAIQHRNFPMRNRLMALLSDATVIVEATEHSGTRYLGWESLRLSRSLFLMENVVNDPVLTWPSEMIKHGAHILSRDRLGQVLDGLGT